MNAPPPVEIRGLRLHNLQDLSLSVPLQSLVAIAGVCGAGKSSLAFDTLFVEGRRRYVEALSTATRQYLDALDRPDVDFMGELPPTVAVRQRFPEVSWRPTVGSVAEVLPVFRSLFAREAELFCPRCQVPLPVTSPHEIATRLRERPGTTRVMIAVPTRPAVSLQALVPSDSDATTSPTPAEWQRQGFSRIIVGEQTRPLAEWSGEDDPAAPPPLIVIDRLTAGQDLARWRESLELAYRVGEGQCLTLSQASDDLPGPRQTIDGQSWLREFWSLHRICETCRAVHPPADPTLFCFNQPRGACPGCRGTGRQAQRRGRGSRSIPPPSTNEESICPECAGQRLRPGSLAWRWGGRSFTDWLSDPIDHFLTHWRERDIQIAQWDAPRQGLASLLVTRLQRLSRLGLGYLPLERPLRTLSAGEAQRVRLAAALTIELVHLLYVLEEPCDGVAASQRPAIIDELRCCRDAGHSVVLIEHDPSLLLGCDHVIELGPGGGADGGRLIYAGTPAGLADVASSPTGAALRTHQSGQSALRPRTGRPPLGWLTLTGLNCQTVRNAEIRLPLGGLTVVTGLSGSGKTSLLRGLADRMTTSPAAATVLVDAGSPAQSPAPSPVEVAFLPATPLARTPRVTAAAFLQIAAGIRQLFAQSLEAQGLNLGPGHFSLHAGAPGLCDECQGLGTVLIDLQFLPNLQAGCGACHGRRFRPEVLSVKYRGLSIAEVLALPVREALAFFRGQVRIQRRLKTLLDVGLENLVLGAPAQRLSPGEMVRLRLAEFLSRPHPSGGALVLLDEPTRGLHPVDLARLVRGFDLATAGGHTVVVATHHTDLIQAADWQIDMGPGAGLQGGQIVGMGVPAAAVAGG